MYIVSENRLNPLAFKRKRTVGRPRNIGPALTKSPSRLMMEPAYTFTGEEECEVEKEEEHSALILMREKEEDW